MHLFHLLQLVLLLFQRGEQLCLRGRLFFCSCLHSRNPLEGGDLQGFQLCETLLAGNDWCKPARSLLQIEWLDHCQWLDRWT